MENTACVGTCPAWPACIGVLYGAATALCQREYSPASGSTIPSATATARSRALFILQKERRFLAQYGKKAVRCLREQPGQRHFDAQRVLQHFDRPRRSLA